MITFEDKSILVVLFFKTEHWILILHRIFLFSKFRNLGKQGRGDGAGKSGNGKPLNKFRQFLDQDIFIILIQMNE